MKTLAQWASQGKGPRYAVFGRHSRYRLADVIAWENAQFAVARRDSAPALRPRRPRLSSTTTTPKTCERPRCATTDGGRPRTHPTPEENGKRRSITHPTDNRVASRTVESGPDRTDYLHALLRRDPALLRGATGVGARSTLRPRRSGRRCSGPRSAWCLDEDSATEPRWPTRHMKIGSAADWSAVAGRIRRGRGSAYIPGGSA